MEQGYDYVDVYECTDVNCDSANMISELTGTYSSTQSATSTTGIMLVHFSKDADVVSRGFAATWTSTAQAATPAPTSVPGSSVNVRVFVYF